MMRWNGPREICSLRNAREIATRNARAAWVNPIFRVPELKAFEPWERQRVLREALRKTRTALPFTLYVCTWVGAIVAYVSFEQILSVYVRGLPVVPLMFALGLPLVFILRSGVRTHLKNRAKGR
jgi:hypothetical protein